MHAAPARETRGRAVAAAETIAATNAAAPPLHKSRLGESPAPTQRGAAPSTRAAGRARARRPPPPPAPKKAGARNPPPPKKGPPQKAPRRGGEEGRPPGALSC